MSLSDIILEKDELIAFVGKHPVLKYNLLVDFIDAYFQGLVLIALNDFKTIPPERGNYLHKLQFALNLNAADAAMKIQQIAKLDDSAQFEMLMEIIPIISEKPAAAALFFLESVAIIVQEKYNMEKAARFCSKLSKMLALDQGSVVCSVGKNLIFHGISFSSISPLAKVYPSGIMAYFFPQVINEIDARNADILAEIMNCDAELCYQKIQKEYPDLGREGILILLLPYLKKLFAQLKKFIQTSEGKRDHSRYYVNLNECKAFNRFLSTIHLLNLYCFKDQDFATNPYSNIPSQISWTQVKEPENVAKETYIAGLKKWLDELEFRLA